MFGVGVHLMINDLLIPFVYIPAIRHAGYNTDNL
jgi:uncharacterized membrane protein YqaE (UPF0057 family)